MGSASLNNGGRRSGLSPLLAALAGMAGMAPISPGGGIFADAAEEKRAAEDWDRAQQRAAECQLAAKRQSDERFDISQSAGKVRSGDRKTVSAVAQAFTSAATDYFNDVCDHIGLPRGLPSAVDTLADRDADRAMEIIRLALREVLDIQNGVKTAEQHHAAFSRLANRFLRRPSDFYVAPDPQPEGTADAIRETGAPVAEVGNGLKMVGIPVRDEADATAVKERVKRGDSLADISRDQMAKLQASYETRTQQRQYGRRDDERSYEQGR